MKTRYRIASFLLAALMLVSLCACGGGGATVNVDEVKPVAQGVTAIAHVIDADEMAAGNARPSAPEDDSMDEPSAGPDEADPDELDGDEDPDPEDPDDVVGDDDDDDQGIIQPGVDPIDDGEGDDDDDESGAVTVKNPGASSTGNTGKKDSQFGSNGYRYQKFVISSAKQNNAVFSGESIMTQISIWSNFVKDPEKKAMTKYAGRDYLSFESTDTLQILNRVWIDETVDYGEELDDIDYLFESIDMASSSATQEKDDWISDKTEGYITSTPSKLTEKSMIDVTSVLYLKDSWQVGTRPYTSKLRRFYNADGTETRTLMFWDEGLTYWEIDNGTAYCMYLTGGNYVMFILPDEGADMADVDVAGLMSGEYSSSKAHVIFTVPQFSVESTYTLGLSNFKLSAGTIDSSAITGLSRKFEPSFHQVSKIDMSPYGVGGYDDGDGPYTETAPKKSDYSDGMDFVEITCDRPFMYYVGDAENEDVAFFGVVNKISKDMAVTVESLGLSD